MADRFTQVVSTYGPRLVAEFGLPVVSSCALWGSFGRETGGFKFYQEIGSTSKTGGRGWAQWTAERRVQFLGWCKTHKLDPKSDEASYGYLCFELHGTYSKVIAALKRCKTIGAAVQTFERLFEGAGVVAMKDREGWARKALAILEPSHPAAVAKSAPAKPASKSSAKKPASDKHAVAPKAKPRAVRKHAAPVHHVVHRGKHR